jgi:hypothetical protein
LEYGPSAEDAPNHLEERIVRKIFSAYLLSAICVFGFLGSAAYGQKKNTTPAHPNGLVQDWSWHHLLFPQIGPQKALLALQHDQRAMAGWQAETRRQQNQWHFGQLLPKRTTEHRDWSISLIGGTTAPGMYPAKFTYDPNATATCADFIIFPVNVAGSTGQPNLVAFNNLYSGTAGSTGFCNRVPVPLVDDGVSATTLWNYNINAIGGAIMTSPALSFDGMKVAVVESAPGVPAHFHVLAYHAGDGLALSAQDVSAPAQITSFTATAPVEGSGTATDLALVSTIDDTTVTLSSPFVDYALDVAYVGNDNGTLFRVAHVFCTIDPVCQGGTPPAPSLDPTWGTGGAISVCPGYEMTGAVVDGLTENILVGCTDGNLYGFTNKGVALTPANVGDGTATGGIVDAPMVDSVNGFVYVATGSGAVTGDAEIVQATTSTLGGQRIARLGAGGVYNLHAPDFNDAYFSSAVSSTWLLYDAALNAAGTTDSLYGIGFNSSHQMHQGLPADIYTPGFAVPTEFSPVTEFLNGTTDQLFFSALTTSPNNFIELYIDSFPSSIAAVASYSSGTSAIVVDNASTIGQASSVYFGVQVENDAVKLTQSGLE